MKINVAKVLPDISRLNLNAIIAVFALFLLCSVWLGLYYLLDNEKQLEVNNVIRDNANLARAFEEHTLRTIKNADQAVLFLKQQYEQNGRATSIPQFVSEGRFFNQPFVFLGVIDENGDLAISNQVPFVASNLKDREHFSIHKAQDNGELFISKPVVGRSSGKWSLQMTRRINKPDGSFGGVAVVSVDPFYFTKFYQEIALGKQSIIALIGMDGIIRARFTNGQSSTGQDLNGSGFMQELGANQAGHYIAPSQLDGHKKIYCYQVLQDYPLAVVVGTNEDAVFRDLQKRANHYYLMTVLGTGIIVFFIIVILMVIAQQKRDRERLRQAHSTMEDMVRLRTQELVTANHELIEEVVERREIEESLRQKTAEIHYMAYTDLLTGLPNWASLNERLKAELSGDCQCAACGSVLFIDLDDLKTVNDSFGHIYGDQLIIMASQRIREIVGGEVFVARTGGDEFVVVLPGNSDPREIEQRSHQLLQALAADSEVFGERFSISASIGIAIYPSDGNSVEEILKNADNAMYAAKRNGKSRWHFFEKELQTAMLEKLMVSNSLRYALVRQEMFLCYQPQVAADSRAIVGFEALIRWRSKEYGLVSPARFIPIAEQSGLIVTIGEWVLRQACRFIKIAAQHGSDAIYVAVNISPRQLAVSHFVELVEEAITEAGIKPDQLELEITENVLLNSMEDAINKFTKLRAIGVRLALDDFGTGFSSLTYLRHLPVGTLKIDKSFIDNILEDKVQAEIIDSIISMAHTLKMKVVAEGVEKEEQLQYLKEHQCDYIQGYLVSPPVIEEEALQYIGNGNKA